MKKPKSKKQYSAIVLLMALLINTGQTSWADSFEPSSTPEETRPQHRNLPTEDIWWTEYGPNMLWNFKNLHQIFPTAQVYRNGPVKQLTRNANSSIGNFEIETPKGKLPFPSSSGVSIRRQWESLSYTKERSPLSHTRGCKIMKNRSTGRLPKPSSEPWFGY